MKCYQDLHLYDTTTIAMKSHKCQSQNDTIENLDFQFLKKLWCCVGGRDENKNLVLSNELIKVEIPP